MELVTFHDDICSTDSAVNYYFLLKMGHLKFIILFYFFTSFKPHLRSTKISCAQFSPIYILEGLSKHYFF